MENNVGSYATTMSNLKSKNYQLNLRRTYDIFKDSPETSAVPSRPQKGTAL